MGKRTRSARMGAQVMRLIDADAIPWFVDGVGNIPVIGKDEVDEMPTIDAVSVKHGEWIKNEDRHGWHCSECKVDNHYAYSWSSEKGTYEFQDNYCPSCGAKMDGERKDDETPDGRL